MTPYERAILKIGSEARAASLLGYKTSWGLARHKGLLPPEKVIEFCRAAGWIATPHEIRPDVYPHPEDGLPAERRALLSAFSELADVLTAADQATLINAAANGPQALFDAVAALGIHLEARGRLLQAAKVCES